MEWCSTCSKHPSSELPHAAEKSTSQIKCPESEEPWDGARGQEADPLMAEKVACRSPNDVAANPAGAATSWDLTDCTHRATVASSSSQKVCMRSECALFGSWDCSCSTLTMHTVHMWHSGLKRELVGSDISSSGTRCCKTCRHPRTLVARCKQGKDRVHSRSRITPPR